MELNWVDGFEINVRIENGAAVISANREGLLSLANHLKSLAEEPPGSHIHLDAYNSLEEGSLELIFETIEDKNNNTRQLKKENCFLKINSKSMEIVA